MRARRSHRFDMFRLFASWQEPPPASYELEQSMWDAAAWWHAVLVEDLLLSLNPSTQEPQPRNDCRVPTPRKGLRLAIQFSASVHVPM